jgi:ankyrin repeat protein
MCRYGRTLLMQASYSGHHSTVGLLVEHHADVNAADK